MAQNRAWHHTHHTNAARMATIASLDNGTLRKRAHIAHCDARVPGPAMAYLQQLGRLGRAAQAATSRAAHSRCSLAGVVARCAGGGVAASSIRLEASGGMQAPVVPGRPHTAVGPVSGIASESQQTIRDLEAVLGPLEPRAMVRAMVFAQPAAEPHNPSLNLRLAMSTRCKQVPPAKPVVVVISGPSGVGKDTVVARLKEQREDLYFVVTATSRFAHLRLWRCQGFVGAGQPMAGGRVHVKRHVHTLRSLSNHYSMRLTYT
jgi:hypothetical protein